MADEAVKAAALEAASKPGATLEDIAKAVAIAEVGSKVQEKDAARVIQAAQAAIGGQTAEARAARFAAALVVLNNPELAPGRDFMALQIERALTAARNSQLGWRRFLPWNWF
jgi:hypothetical protein